MPSYVGTAGDDSIVGPSNPNAATAEGLSGLEGNDTLVSIDESDRLDGGAGDDVLRGHVYTEAWGGDGADRLEGVYRGFGDAGNDTLIGDTSGGSFGSALHGGTGDDSILGTDAEDLISGGNGANIISAGGGNDTFVAFDYLFHGGSMAIADDGSPGSNTIDGGSGTDTLSFATFWGDGKPVEGRVVVDLSAGTATSSAFTHINAANNAVSIQAGSFSFVSFENAYTGAGNDSINGSAANNYLEANSGADTVFGGEGNDTIHGDTEGTPPGTDGGNFLRGDNGDDHISGGSAGDQIEGGAGNDTIEGYAGADTLSGGDGNDTILGGLGPDLMSGGAGTNRFMIQVDDLDAHSAFADRITDWSSSDVLYYNNDYPSAYVERISASYDAAYEDANTIIQNPKVGSLYISFVVEQVGVDVIVFSNTYSPFDNSPSQIDHAVILSGRTLSDVADGSIAGAIQVDIGSGPPPPTGPSGPGQPPPGTLSFNTLSSSAALSISVADKIAFTSGTATLITVAYNLDGTVAVSMGGQSLTFGSAIADVSKAGNIAMPDGSKLFIGLSGAESFAGASTGDAAFGGLGDDTLDGGAGGDLLQGNQGIDSLVGGEGDDTVYGGQDDDILSMGSGGNFGQGNKGSDTIAGGTGIDTLLGGQDNDTISGDAGSDFLNGNRGDDSILGGTGNDTIYGEGGTDALAGGAGADVFHAFVGQEIDRILDFSRAEGDRIVLAAGMTHSEAQVGADVVVSLGGGDQFVLVGVNLSALTGDWIGL